MFKVKIVLPSGYESLEPAATQVRIQKGCLWVYIKGGRCRVVAPGMWREVITEEYNENEEG